MKQKFYKLVNLCILLILLVIFIPSQSVKAAFVLNRWTSKVVTNASNDQLQTEMISDNSGNAILVWNDSRGLDEDIYVQKIDKDGNQLWTNNGVLVVNQANEQIDPQLTTDGSGGAFVIWSDARVVPAAIYVQRISSNGVLQFGTEVKVANSVNMQGSAKLAADGSGGIYVVWEDNYGVSGSDVYVQRIDASGNRLWGANGVVVSNAADSQANPKVLKEKDGGAFIAWQDNRSGNRDIYVQHFNASGGATLTANGQNLTNVAGEQTAAEILVQNNSLGGMIVVWQDTRSGNTDLYAQWVQKTGGTVWTANGIPVVTASGNQIYQQIIGDDADGAIIAWSDLRSDAGDVYAQRMSSLGVAQWTNNGIIISNATSYQTSPQLIKDGYGGAIITWQDGRAGNDDIYAQRIGNSGAVHWIANGHPVENAVNNQTSPKIVTDEVGGAIIAFGLTAGSVDIYAQRLSTDQNLYRFWSSDYLSHFYTINLSERNNVINNDFHWNYEGIGFNVLGFDYNTQNCVDPAAAKIYRFWSPVYLHHFYTINETEKNNVIANDPNWDPEFYVFCGYTTQVTGSKPVHRFWSPYYRGHFYTISETEKNNVINNDFHWEYEGIVYYAFD